MKKDSGFTLIELMVVVVILAILLGIALPLYKEQVKSGRRAGAQSALTSFSAAMEREFTNRGTYARADGDDASEAEGDNAAPTMFATEAPLDSDTKYYDLRINLSTITAYRLIAIPKNAQAGDGSLAISNTGERVWDKNNDGDYDDDGESCWTKSC